MRLQRIGRKNDASFRVVVTDSRRGPKSGKHVDLLGSYNPKMNEFKIDGDKAKDWIAKGVQVSDTMHNLLVGEGVIEGKKVNVLPKKSPIISEQSEEEAKPAAEEASTDEAPAAEATPEEAEAPAEEAVEEAKEEEVVEEKKEEAAEESSDETPAEEASEESKEEEKAE